MNFASNLNVKCEITIIDDIECNLTDFIDLLLIKMDCIFII